MVSAVSLFPSFNLPSPTPSLAPLLSPPPTPLFVPSSSFSPPLPPLPREPLGAATHPLLPSHMAPGASVCALHLRCIPLMCAGSRVPGIQLNGMCVRANCTRESISASFVVLVHTV